MSRRPGARELVERAYRLETPEQGLSLYRDWAGDYEHSMVDELRYISPGRCADLLAEHLETRDARILDVGCGTGLAGAALAAHGFSRLSGVDLSPEMLAQARHGGHYTDLHLADLRETLPFESGHFGGAICTGTFTHAHVGAAALDEVARCLAIGGVFAFTVHRDVWESLGFASALAAWRTLGVAEEILRREGPYYEGGEEREGYYCVYRRLRGRNSRVDATTS